MLKGKVFGTLPPTPEPQKEDSENKVLTEKHFQLQNVETHKRHVKLGTGILAPS